jgi:hypothetical protein
MNAPRTTRNKSARALPQVTATRGTVHVQYRACGSRSCRCVDGERHAAYFLFWRDGGRLRKRYLRAAEVDGVRAACARRRLRERRLRALVRGDLVTWRELTGRLREMERHGRSDGD